MHKSIWNRLVDRVFPLTEAEEKFWEEEARLLKVQSDLLEQAAREHKLLFDRKAECIRRRDQRRQQKKLIEQELVEDYRQVAFAYMSVFRKTDKETIDIEFVVRLMENRSKNTPQRTVEVTAHRQDNGIPVNIVEGIPGFFKSNVFYNTWIVPWWDWKLSTEDLKKSERFHFPGEDKPKRPKKKKVES